MSVQTVVVNVAHGHDFSGTDFTLLRPQASVIHAFRSREHGNGGIEFCLLSLSLFFPLSEKGGAMDRSEFERFRARFKTDF